MRLYIQSFEGNTHSDSGAHYVDLSMINRLHRIHALYLLKRRTVQYSNDMATNVDMSQWTVYSINEWFGNCCSSAITEEELIEWIQRETKHKNERKRQEAAIEAATNQPDVEDGGEIADRDGERERPTPTWQSEMTQEDVERAIEDIARRDNL